MAETQGQTGQNQGQQQPPPNGSYSDFESWKRNDYDGFKARMEAMAKAFEDAKKAAESAPKPGFATRNKSALYAVGGIVVGAGITYGAMKLTGRA